MDFIFAEHSEHKDNKPSSRSLSRWRFANANLTVSHNFVIYWAFISGMPASIINSPLDNYSFRCNCLHLWGTKIKRFHLQHGASLWWTFILTTGKVALGGCLAYNTTIQCITRSNVEFIFYSRTVLLASCEAITFLWSSEVQSWNFLQSPLWCSKMSLVLAMNSFGQMLVWNHNFKS